MKEKKELIDVVVDKLKNMKEPPYRTGSWEKFKQLQTSKPVVYRRPTMWYAAASVLLCLGVAAGFWIMNNDRTALEGAIGDTVAVGVTETPQERNTVLRAERREGLTGPEMIDPIVTNVSTVDVYSRTQHGNTVNRLDRLEEGNGLQIKEEVSIPQLAYLPGKGVTYGSHQDISLVGSASDSENRILANSALDHYNTLTMKPMESQPRNTHIRLGKQFELGLFISPYATSNQMNVGGGLVVSYKLNKVLSIRTGASYNNYEIQMVKNPIEESSTEAVDADADIALAKDAVMTRSSYQQKMIIPNINAITGFVKSVDIPLEIKVNNIHSSIYATAGMSYSAILNQRRNAHYVENLNIETFADGYPENREQANNAVKPVTRVVESTEENVNTNGFSGFVNFSIGKNVRINKKVGFSVEPYLKIPVGQYRRAEMDYTNGGIRVMTNF